MKSKIESRKEYRGYELIVRIVGHGKDVANPFFYPGNNYWYCGYVVIPKDSPFYGMDYEDLKDDIRVHGGLTFSGELDGIDGYLLGFDCNHANDSNLIQNETYTVKECERLIDQLIHLSEVDKEKTYRYEVHCEIDVKASTGVEARKKLEEEYGSFFHTFIGIVNEDGEIEDED